MIANILGGLLMIAAGLFPLYFKLKNWWWLLGGAMIVFGGMVIYSSTRSHDCWGTINPNLSQEEIDKAFKGIKNET